MLTVYAIYKVWANFINIRLNCQFIGGNIRVVETSATWGDFATALINLSQNMGDLPLARYDRQWSYVFGRNLCFA